MRSNTFLNLSFLIFFFKSCQSFLWDKHTVERLFGNRQEVFDKLVKEVENSDDLICLQNFDTWIKNVFANEISALTALDAWGKMPTGLGSGNNIDLGHFDQCINAQLNYNADDEGHGLYCQLPLFTSSAPRNVSFSMAVCVPNSCAAANLMLSKIFKEFLANIEYSTSSGFQCSDGKTEPFGAMQWVGVSFLTLMGVLLIGSTIYDYRIRRLNGAKPIEEKQITANPVFTSFSLQTNAFKLFETKTNTGTFECINGLRVLSIAWVVLHHSFSYDWFIPAIYNRADIQKYWLRSMGWSFVTHGDVSVDTFLVVSGFLISINFFKSREKNQPFVFHRYYIKRYLRLTPVLAAAILLVLAFAMYLGTGPNHENIDWVLLENCRKYWWSALVHIQNFQNPFQECLGPTWYVSVDFQLFCLSPIFLFSLAKFGYRSLWAFGLICLLSAINVFTLCIVFGFYFSNRPINWNKQVYLPTYNRIGPWLIGIVLGYVIFRQKNQRVNLSKSAQSLIWLITLISMVSIVLGPYFAYRNESKLGVTFAFHQALHRFIWGLAIAWIIYACIKGYGGVINWFLSFATWQFPAKLSYCIYILHFPLFVIIKTMQRTSDFYDPFMIFTMSISVFGLTMLLAIPWTLSFEIPVINLDMGLEKLFNKNKNSK